MKLFYLVFLLYVICVNCIHYDDAWFVNECEIRTRARTKSLTQETIDGALSGIQGEERAWCDKNLKFQDDVAKLYVQEYGHYLKNYFNSQVARNLKNTFTINDVCSSMLSAKYHYTQMEMMGGQEIKYATKADIRHKLKVNKDMVETRQRVGTTVKQEKPAPYNPFYRSHMEECELNCNAIRGYFQHYDKTLLYSKLGYVTTENPLWEKYQGLFSYHPRRIYHYYFDNKMKNQCWSEELNNEYTEQVINTCRPIIMENADSKKPCEAFLNWKIGVEEKLDVCVQTRFRKSLKETIIKRPATTAAASNTKMIRLPTPSRILPPTEVTPNLSKYMHGDNYCYESIERFDKNSKVYHDPVLRDCELNFQNILFALPKRHTRMDWLTTNRKITEIVAEISADYRKSGLPRHIVVEMAGYYQNTLTDYFYTKASCEAICTSIVEVIRGLARQILNTSGRQAEHRFMAKVFKITKKLPKQ